MSQLAELVDEMAANLRAAVDASDLYTDSRIAVQIERGYLINPTPPVIDIYPADPFTFTEGDGFGDDAVGFLFTVRARIDTADQDAGQDFLLTLLDPADDLSVAVALEDDQTLNGYASSVDVRNPTGFRLYEDVGAAGWLLGCEWTVAVLRAYS